MEKCDEYLFLPKRRVVIVQCAFPHIDHDPIKASKWDSCNDIVKLINHDFCV